MSKTAAAETVPEASKPYRMHDRQPAAAVDLRADVVAGLRGDPASISPRWFYDELGSALYTAITRLPEYYPTRVENELMRGHRDEIARHVARRGQLVDLGSGDCCKAVPWLAMIDPARYVAVDVAGHEIERALARLAPDFPGVQMAGVVTDFSRRLDLEGVLDARPVTFFYPGSSIGNFTPAEAVRLLAQVAAYCAALPASGLLIGVDGKKDKAVLEAAYDDALGVTAAFNRNALAHLNRRLGFDFDPAAFAHRAFYDEAEGRIEMHLEALRDLEVDLGERAGKRRFARGERIHTENSYKYRPEEFERMLSAAGFGSVRRWSAGGDAYSVFFASRASRTPENCQRASGGKKLR